MIEIDEDTQHALILLIVILFILVAYFNNLSALQILIIALTILAVSRIAVCNGEPVEHLDTTKLTRPSYTPASNSQSFTNNTIVETNKYRFGHSLFELVPTYVKKDNRYPDDADYNSIMNIFNYAGLVSTGSPYMFHNTDESFIDQTPDYFKKPGTKFLRSRGGEIGTTNSANLASIQNKAVAYSRLPTTRPLDRDLNRGDLTDESIKVHTMSSAAYSPDNINSLISSGELNTGPITPRMRAYGAAPNAPTDMLRTDQHKGLYSSANKGSGIAEGYTAYPDVLYDPRYDPSGAFDLAKRHYYLDANRIPHYSNAPKKNVESTGQPYGKNMPNPSTPWQSGQQLGQSATMEPVNDYTEYDRPPPPDALVIDSGGKVMTPMPDPKIELDPMLHLLPQNHPTIMAMKHSDAARLKNRVYGRDSLNKTLVQDVLSYRQIPKWSSA